MLSSCSASVASACSVCRSQAASGWRAPLRRRDHGKLRQQAGAGAHLGLLRLRLFPGETEERRAQHPHHLFEPLRIAAQPVQVIGHAARHAARRTRRTQHAQAPAGQEAEGVHRSVGDNPGVLADAAALHRDDKAVRIRAHAAQSARHDMAGIARDDRKRAPDHAARLRLVANPDRRGREVEQLLRHPGVRLGAHRAIISVAPFGIEFGHEHRLARALHKGALQNPALGSGQHHLQFAMLAAPPRRRTRHREFLAEQMAAQVRAGREAAPASPPRRRPGALASATLPLRQASTRPGTPSVVSARSSSGSQKLSSTRRTITSTRRRPSSVFKCTRRSRTVRSAPSTSGKPR